MGFVLVPKLMRFIEFVLLGIGVVLFLLVQYMVV
ncbi:unnamed protein product [Strongylus vulgaris]|uniref:Uncharacterized protein n=1 Tax=Strongylus vulgaris TaxID=40348 RepID=A0A3P7L055_STRVU|nr:unnamed protein product [Strongylus vulgaris]